MHQVNRISVQSTTVYNQGSSPKSLYISSVYLMQASRPYACLNKHTLRENIRIIINTVTDVFVLNSSHVHVIDISSKHLLFINPKRSSHKQKAANPYSKWKTQFLNHLQIAVVKTFHQTSVCSAYSIINAVFVALSTLFVTRQR